MATKRLDREQRPGWIVYSILTAGVFFVLFVLAGTGFSGYEDFVPIGGLLQRLSLTVGFAWASTVRGSPARRGWRWCGWWSRATWSWPS